MHTEIVHHEHKEHDMDTMTTQSPLDAPLTAEELSVRVQRRFAAKRALEAAQAALAQIDAELIAGMQANALTSVSDPTGHLKLTVTAGTRVKVDPELLEANVSQRLWVKLTTRVLDMDAYKAFKATGAVKPEVVELVEQVTSTAPYLVASAK